jgi:hypothetical protein
VKGSACLARRRQRAACSLKLASSITHQPGGVCRTSNQHRPRSFLSGCGRHIGITGSIRFPHGCLL